MYFDEEFELSNSGQGSERIEASTRTARRRHEGGSQVARGYHTSTPPSTKSQWTTSRILSEGWRKIEISVRNLVQIETANFTPLKPQRRPLRTGPNRPPSRRIAETDFNNLANIIDIMMFICVS